MVRKAVIVNSSTVSVSREALLLTVAAYVFLAVAVAFVEGGWGGGGDGGWRWWAMRPDDS